MIRSNPEQVISALKEVESRDQREWVPQAGGLPGNRLCNPAAPSLRIAPGWRGCRHSHFFIFGNKGFESTFCVGGGSALPHIPCDRCDGTEDKAAKLLLLDRFPRDFWSGAGSHRPFERLLGFRI